MKGEEMAIKNYDNTLVGKYIREIENPDSIGYRNGRWYKPTNINFDFNNRGFGVDVENNNDAVELTNGRDGKWLTEQEEKDLRNRHIEYGLDRLNFWTPKILATPPSEAKQAMAEGMLYRGDGVKTIINDQKMRDAYYSGSDSDFQKLVSDHYKKKNLNERAVRHNKFMNNNKPKPKHKPTFVKSWDEIGKNIKYDDGGQLDTPKLWDDLSLSEKADVMEIAVRHGLRDLNEIRQAYNDFAENPLEDEADDNTFKNGGYVPSNSIKKRIANWEGSSMKTNRSFEDEAKDFNRVIPEDIRKNLSQQQLDALYSYGYNVGMGNLKKRTLPVLRDYVNGHAGAKDVANGMWASKDNTLRGLRNRRDWERNSFIGNAPTGRQGSVVDDVLNMDLSYLAQQQPLFESNPTEYTAPAWMQTPEIKLDDNNPTIPLNEQENAEPVNNGWGLLSLMSSLEEPEDMPFTGYEKPTNRFALGVIDNDSFLDSSWFSDGGYLHGHRFDDGGPDGNINRNYKAANLKDLTERSGQLFNTNELQVADELQRLGADAPMLRDYSTTLPNVTVTAKRPNPAEDIDKVILGHLAVGTLPLVAAEAGPVLASTEGGKALATGVKTGDWVPMTSWGLRAGIDIGGGLSGGAFFDNRSKAINGKTVGENVSDAINYYTGKRVPTLITDLANPGYWVGGYAASSLYNSAEKRAIETFMRTTASENPIPEVVSSWKQMPLTRKAAIANYILTGYQGKFHPFEYANSFSPHSYYNGFTYNGGRGAHDMIDAYLYKKNIDPVFGLKKVKSGDFGMHKEYVDNTYSKKAKDIQTYEQPVSKNTGEAPPKDSYFFNDAIRSSMDYDSAIMPYGSVNTGGHLIQYGRLPNGKFVKREQDIWKFNRPEYMNNWKEGIRIGNYMITNRKPSKVLDFLTNFGIHEVDRVGTPVITKTLWHEVSPNVYRNARMDKIIRK